MYGFGKALDVMRDGDLVTRHHWQPVDPFGVWPCLRLEPQTESDTGDRVVLAQISQLTVSVDTLYVAPWAPTHGDLLADDWDHADNIMPASRRPQ
jgi:uncharacterized protein DUF2829